MLYAILCYDSEEVVGAWSAETESAVMGRLDAVQQKLRRDGRLGPVARLMPTTTATTVRKGAEPLVLDGPFAETKEQLWVSMSSIATAWKRRSRSRPSWARPAARPEPMRCGR
jgi:hypothetical protein